MSSLGGPQVPGVGFAFGLERLMFALESIEFKGAPSYLHLFLMVLGDEQKADGIALVNRCRLGGLFTEMDFLDKGMKQQFKLASNLDARFVAIYGDQDKANGTINVKDQETGNEKTMPKDELYNYIMEELLKPTQSCQDCTEESCDSC